MRIFLNDIQVRARHGVMEQEAVVGGDFLVSVSMDADVDKAGETDDIADTVNYADIAEVVRQEMAIRSKLLEHVATRIARRLLADFPAARSVTVRITKLCPPIPALQSSGAGVEVTMKN